jgi:NTE family protein
MGNDFMARDRVDEIVQQAFLAAGAHAARLGIRAALAPLRRG